MQQSTVHGQFHKSRSNVEVPHAGFSRLNDTNKMNQITAQKEKPAWQKETGDPVRPNVLQEKTDYTRHTFDFVILICGLPGLRHLMLVCCREIKTLCGVQHPAGGEPYLLL